MDEYQVLVKFLSNLNPWQTIHTPTRGLIKENNDAGAADYTRAAIYWWRTWQ